MRARASFIVVALVGGTRWLEKRQDILQLRIFRIFGRLLRLHFSLPLPVARIGDSRPPTMAGALSWGLSPPVNPPPLERLPSYVCHDPEKRRRLEAMVQANFPSGLVR